MFKEIADIKTSDQLNLPVPEAKFETVVVQPSEYQQEMVSELSERAAAFILVWLTRLRTICSRLRRMDENLDWISD